MLFVGYHEHSVDAKQRLAIPSEVRRRLDRAGQGDAVYAVLQEGVLCFYPEQVFEKLAEQLDNSELSPDEVLRYERVFFANAAFLELDKQGRVRLPERMLTRVGLDRDVIIAGAKDHLEVHPREAWMAENEQLMDEQPEMMKSPRRLMRAGGSGNRSEQKEG